MKIVYYLRKNKNHSKVCENRKIMRGGAKIM